MNSSEYLKPLFNKRLLQEALINSSLVVTEAQRLIAKNWASAASCGALFKQNERQLQGPFLSEIFDRLLGFSQIVGSQAGYFMKPETSSTQVKDNKTPDARLGWFGVNSEITRAVVELKSPGINLDKKQGVQYGNLTPVEQAFGYAVKDDGCRWVVVSNFTTIRLYRTDRGQGYCHIFEMTNIDTDESLSEFLFLMLRGNLLGLSQDEESISYKLASHTYVEEERITKEFYCFFRDLRLDLFYQLRQDNSTPLGMDKLSHENRLLGFAQKILDRVLFICFCEDKGLLPAKVLHKALTAKNEGFVQTSHWQQLCGLFAAVDSGNPPMRINGYNGGLFAKDTNLDGLSVSDSLLDKMLKISSYDFGTDLNVKILGHIFEQSINDLESIRAGILGDVVDINNSQRKRDGIFYTPEFITRFIVSRSIGGWLKERFEELETRHKTGKPGPMSKADQQRLWHDYLDVLAHIKILDIACGSGAFLVAAFDYLSREYDHANRMLAELSGQATQLGIFDLDRQILQENLFGVDLNPESVEITKLSLWLKTAHRDKPLNNLDANIQCGNSLIEPVTNGSPPELQVAYAALPMDARPFDWRKAFPTIIQRGGFDIIIGNPPYVRQESIAPFKPYLRERYASYHGVADLYVYFYEQGLNLLNSNGKLSYIVSNKWLKAGYGKPLRRLFSEQAEFEEIIDFGHAPIFEDADTFPCIVLAHRRPYNPDDMQVRVCPVPRDRPSELSLEQYTEEHAYQVPWKRFGADSWSLESPAVDALMCKIRERGIPLREFAGVKPLYGIKTGFNKAFLINDATRLDLINQDPGCAEVIKPYLRGQDIKRWMPHWQKLWIIVLASSGNVDWPWGNAGELAEDIFAKTFPSLYRCMKSYEDPLRKREDQGRYWWELRSCDYYASFDNSKCVIQRIAFHPCFPLDGSGMFVNDSAVILSTNDLWICGVLNSPTAWYFMFKSFPHKKDEAVAMDIAYLEMFPIPQPTEAIRAEAENNVKTLTELSSLSHQKSQELFDWLRLEYGIIQLGQKLEDYASLTADSFAAEVKQRIPKLASRLTPAKLTELKKFHDEYATLERKRKAEIMTLERRLADLVNQAYGLSKEDIELLWKTAPPRMPIKMVSHD